MTLPFNYDILHLNYGFSSKFNYDIHVNFCSIFWRFFEQAEISYVPKTTTELTNPDDITKMEKLIDALEDNDDVQNVYHTWEMPDVDEEE